MSRRDTIIIAVLVNAGLLMVLFATAFKSNKKTEEIVAMPVVAAPKVEEPLTQLAMTPTLPLPPIEQSQHEEITIALPEPIVVVEPPKPALVEPEKAYVRVTVKKGDFLEKIAKANGTSVATIMKENQLTNTQLKVGQVLKIPTSGTVVAKESAPAAPAADRYYVVKEGDNPWLIASKNHVRLEELLRLNGLDEQSARRLRPGDRLKIR